MKILPALGLALALAAPLSAGDDYLLEIPLTAELGDTWQTCITAPAGDLVYLIVSGGLADTPTPYGTLGVALPPIVIWTLFMPPVSPLCFDHLVHCDPALVGLTAHFQFLSVDPQDPSQRGLSNVASLTVEDDDCTEPGDFASFTQGGWGTSCHGNNPGCRRDLYFDTVFPDGLVLGDADGVDGDLLWALELTSSAAVEAFLPHGGPAGPLTGDELDPLGSSAGVLAGQLTAATLNLGFDDAGVFDDLKAKDTLRLGDLLYNAGVHPLLIGWRVRDVVDLAHGVISGETGPTLDLDDDGHPDVGVSELNEALTRLNENFVDGTTDEKHLTVP